MIVKRLRRWAGLEEFTDSRPAMEPAGPRPLRVLMVCTGNICRSPTAEGVLRAKLQRLGLHGRIEVDSAGTQGYHTSEPPDPRAIKHAAQRGYDIAKLKARPVSDDDFVRFDWLLAMDESHLNWLRKRQPPETQARTKLLMAYARHHADVPEVPDPYYGGAAGFDRVLDLVEDACEGLAAHLASQAPPQRTPG
jgi:protein-tyrosine phosphatase